MPPSESHAETGDHRAAETPRSDRRAPIAQTAEEEMDGLYRFAVSRLGSWSHTAFDVVQQALVIALQHAAPPEHAEAQRAWLRGIVINVIRRNARSARRRRIATSRARSEPKHARSPASAAESGAADDRRAVMVRTLFEAVAELDAADQELFYAFYRAGRSHASIAHDEGTTPKAVEARLYRLRARLRARIEPEGNEP